MSSCCDSIAQTFPEAGSACREIERRYRFACPEMDTPLSFVDYSGPAPQRTMAPADHTIDVRDIVHWSTLLATLEWLDAFRQQQPLNPMRSFFHALPRELRPPSIITDAGVLKDVRTMMRNARDASDLFARLVAYHFAHIHYTRVFDGKAPTADAVYAQGITSCLPASAALYGVLQLGGFQVAIAEQPQPVGAAFHIGVVAEVSGQMIFIDPAASSGDTAVTPQTTEIPLPTAYLQGFYWSEAVHGAQLSAVWLQRAQALLPQDFHMAYSLAVFYELHGEMDQARLWYRVTQQLNPGYVVATLPAH